MKVNRIRRADVADIRMEKVTKQGGKCPLCGCNLLRLPGKDVVLDHDHRTGALRGALCRNCNGMEGKVYNRATRAKRELTEEQWLENLVAYYRGNRDSPDQRMHWAHKTPEEKRLERNAKARLARARKAAVKNLK